MCVKVSIDHSSVLFVLLVEVSSDQFCCAMITLQMLRTRKLGVWDESPEILFSVLYRRETKLVCIKGNSVLLSDGVFIMT